MARAIALSFAVLRMISAQNATCLSRGKTGVRFFLIMRLKRKINARIRANGVCCSAA
jgi:hypothetical protein